MAEQKQITLKEDLKTPTCPYLLVEFEFDLVQGKWKLNNHRTIHNNNNRRTTDVSSS